MAIESPTSPTSRSPLSSQIGYDPKQHIPKPQPPQKSAWGFTTTTHENKNPNLLQSPIVDKSSENLSETRNSTPSKRQPLLQSRAAKTPSENGLNCEALLNRLSTSSSYNDFDFIARQNLDAKQLQTLIIKLTQTANPRVINHPLTIDLINNIGAQLNKYLLINQGSNLEQIKTLIICISRLGNTFSPYLRNNQNIILVTNNLQEQAVNKLGLNSTIEDFIFIARLPLNESTLAIFIHKLNTNQNLETATSDKLNQLAALLLNKYVSNSMLSLNDYVICMQNITQPISLAPDLCDKFIDHLTEYSDIDCFLFIALQELSIDQIKTLNPRMLACINDYDAQQIDIDDNVITQLNESLCNGFINQLNSQSTHMDYSFLFNEFQVSPNQMESLLNKKHIDIMHLQLILDQVNISNNYPEQIAMFNSIIDNHLDIKFPQIYRLTNAINDDLYHLMAPPISYYEVDYILQLHYGSTKKPISMPLLLPKKPYNLTRSVTLLSYNEILIHPFMVKNMDTESPLVTRGSNKIVKSSAIKITLHPDKSISHHPVVTISQSPLPNNSPYLGVLTKNEHLAAAIDQMAKEDGFTPITYRTIKNGKLVRRVKYYKKYLGKQLHTIKDGLTPEEKRKLTDQIIQQFEANPTINDPKEDNILYEDMLTIHRRNLYQIFHKLPRNDELVNPFDYHNRLKQNYSLFNKNNYNKLLKEFSVNPNKLIQFKQILETLNPVNNLHFIDFLDPVFTYTTKNDKNMGRYDSNSDPYQTEQQRLFGICYLLYRLHEPRNTPEAYGAAWNCEKKPDRLTLNPSNPFANLTQILYQGKVQYDREEVLVLLKNALKPSEPPIHSKPKVPVASAPKRRAK
ncbi:MAG: hypothetical protein KBD37_03850 [Burkholderiales bacterium]|nr:hypothetical protein [Burkholderiales bacterium]